MLIEGIYEQLISEALARELAKAEGLSVVTGWLDKEEAAKALAQYLGGAAEQALRAWGEVEGLGAQVALANRMLEALAEAQAALADRMQEAAGEARGLYVKSPAALLHSVRSQLNALATEYPRPETSIARSTLFTSALNEPNLVSELKKEILSCDRIDLLVSFIKKSGLNLIQEELEQFARRGGRLRVITTAYMGATEASAVSRLHRLPYSEVRVSYDTARTRLHAKAYVFHRLSGFSTAYVGSSNLTRPAISEGLEWNVKLTEQDQPDALRKIEATFEHYWHSPEFEPYDDSQRERLTRALLAERAAPEREALGFEYFFEIRPYPYQQEILNALQAERQVRDSWHNLVVAATGTGKTVIAAFDYKRFRKENPGRPGRLLFVAHRMEILEQSLQCFRGVLRDANFGELFVGGYVPEGLDHLFVSIQTLNARDLCARISADFYDYIVVDEFHHAAAPSYRELLKHLKPRILLGLTATPERMDGADILNWFGGRAAAEIRLPEAIERRLLCPFQYYGVTDEADLRHLRWTRGGYDRGELSNLYTIGAGVAERRVALVLGALDKYAGDLSGVKGLGFCVSVEHAAFMAERFSRAGIPSRCVTGETPKAEREGARQALESGELRFIFTVDVYNEGVDIPELNTVLFLRPTESLTVFLQQLGRGLRLAPGKEILTALDFIGQAHRRYDFHSKLAALLGGTRRGLKREIEAGFSSAPKGCYIHLEKLAQKHVLDNLRESLNTRLSIVRRIQSFREDTGLELSLENFCDGSHLEPRSLYRFDSFSRLCADAGVGPAFTEPLEEVITKALPRFCHLNSRRWIDFLLKALNQARTLTDGELSPGQKRMLAMFRLTLWGQQDPGFEQATDALRAVAANPVLCGELKALLALNRQRIDFVDEPSDLGFDCPLDVGCRYSRNQALAALDHDNPFNIHEGVCWLPGHQLDVFFVTLNKSEKDYRPSTLYRDYPVSETQFHWQSQSTTSETSPTGQRYIHHRERGSRILLFVRENKKDPYGGAPPYDFLGEVLYQSHTGSRPMNILLTLKTPLPPRLLKTG